MRAPTLTFRRRPRTTASGCPGKPESPNREKTGKFSDFSRFLRKSVPKTLGIQLFTDEFPRKQNRESIRDNKETNSREQGTIRELAKNPIRSPPRIRWRQNASSWWITNNQQPGWVRVRTNTRPRHPGSNPQSCMTKLKRSAKFRAPPCSTFAFALARLRANWGSTARAPNICPGGEHFSIAFSHCNNIMTQCARRRQAKRRARSPVWRRTCEKVSEFDSDLRRPGRGSGDFRAKPKARCCAIIAFLPAGPARRIAWTSASAPRR